MKNPTQLGMTLTARDPLHGAPATRAEQIFAAFAEFHRANPSVWFLFEKYALEMASVRAHYSANAIFERLRFHLDLEIKQQGYGEAVKLNNNFRALYARLFAVAHPEHAEFFRNRKRTSEAVPAHKEDIQVFNAGPPGDEEEGLLVEMEQLLPTTEKRRDQ